MGAELLALVLATAPRAAEFEGHNGPFHVQDRRDGLRNPGVKPSVLIEQIAIASVCHIV